MQGLGVKGLGFRGVLGFKTLAGSGFSLFWKRCSPLPASIVPIDQLAVSAMISVIKIMLARVESKDRYGGSGVRGHGDGGNEDVELLLVLLLSSQGWKPDAKNRPNHQPL